MSHIPVLVSEMLAALSPREGETYIDATFGGGGYAQAILEAADCQVIAFDRDPDAVTRGAVMEKKFSGRLRVVQGTFTQIETHLKILGIFKVNGIVFDLGVSSWQLDTAERGFSFRFDGPLDMRMSREGASAAEVVNTFSCEDLANIIYRYGEEKRSRTIARHIEAARRQSPLKTTFQLADLIKSVIKSTKPGQHPATRTFQALRIYVNDELGEIDHGLIAAENCLGNGGRLVVVTFHSLEDRLVKQFIKSRCGETSQGTRHLPASATATEKKFAQGKKTGVSSQGISPGLAEIEKNPRCRSARLRAAIRLPLSPSVSEGIGWKV
jgi:16S rRNA (cytosine1402-N4)-methyltransferase